MSCFCFTRSHIECASICTVSSFCTSFLWIKSLQNCLLANATFLVGDYTNSSVEVDIDGSFKPGFLFIYLLYQRVLSYLVSYFLNFWHTLSSYNILFQFLAHFLIISAFLAYVSSFSILCQLLITF